MSQLLSPSAALGSAFDLPLVEAESNRSESRLVGRSETLNTYALELQHFGLLLPINTPSTLIEDELPSCLLPNTPYWLECMVSWNGVAVPVFRLETLLDFDEPELAALKVLIIGQGEDAVGIRVSAVPFRITLRSEEKLTRTPPLPQMLQPFARGCYRTDRIWIDWDYQGFFAAVANRF